MAKADPTKSVHQPNAGTHIIAAADLPAFLKSMIDQGRRHLVLSNDSVTAVVAAEVPDSGAKAVLVAKPASQPVATGTADAPVETAEAPATTLPAAKPPTAEEIAAAKGKHKLVVKPLATKPVKVRVAPRISKTLGK